MKRVIDFRFILTPYAKTTFRVRGIERDYHYIFGFKILDIVVK